MQGNVLSLYSLLYRTQKENVFLFVYVCVCVCVKNVLSMLGKEIDDRISMTGYYTWNTA